MSLHRKIPYSGMAASRMFCFSKMVNDFFLCVHKCGIEWDKKKHHNKVCFIIVSKWSNKADAI